MNDSDRFQLRSGGWHTLGHDFCGWRLAGNDVVPPLRVVCRAAFESNLCGGEITGTADGRIAIVTMNGRVRLLDRELRPIWEARPGKGRLGTHVGPPVIVGEQVIQAFMKRMRCFSLTDGKLLWEVADQAGRDINAGQPIDMEEDYFFGIQGVSADGCIAVVSKRGAIRKMRLATGETQSVFMGWMGGNGTGNLVMAHFREHDRLPPGPSRMFDIDAGRITGEADWGDDGGDGFHHVGDRVVLATGRYLTAFEISTGRRLWRNDTEPGVVHTSTQSATDGERLYVQRWTFLGQNRLVHTLAAHSLADGEEVWRVSADVGFWKREFVLSPRFVYTRDGQTMRVLNKADGQTVWQSGPLPELDSLCADTFSIIGNRLFVERGKEVIGFAAE